MLKNVFFCFLSFFAAPHVIPHVLSIFTLIALLFTENPAVRVETHSQLLVTLVYLHLFYQPQSHMREPVLLLSRDITQKPLLLLLLSYSEKHPT